MSYIEFVEGLSSIISENETLFRQKGLVTRYQEDGMEAKKAKCLDYGVCATECSEYEVVHDLKY